MAMLNNQRVSIYIYIRFLLFFKQMLATQKNINHLGMVYTTQPIQLSFAQVRSSVLLPVICQLFYRRDQVQLRVVINVQRQRRVQRQVGKVQFLP